MKKLWDIFKKEGKKLLRIEFLAGVFLFLLFYIAFAFLLREQMQYVFSFVNDHIVAGAVIYVLFFAVSIIFVPLSSLPFMLFTERIFGVFVGGTLSLLGWWLGGVVLFFIARYVGRPLLEKRMSFEKIQEWEDGLPKNATFVGVFFANMIFPTELIALLFGCLTQARLRLYALASFLGMIPFSYLSVATGGAVFTKSWESLLLFGVAIVVFFLVAFFVWRKYIWKKKK